VRGVEEGDDLEGTGADLGRVGGGEGHAVVDARLDRGSARRDNG
jgi:hypothetical protein